MKSALPDIAAAGEATANPSPLVRVQWGDLLDPAKAEATSRLYASAELLSEAEITAGLEGLRSLRAAVARKEDRLGRARFRRSAAAALVRQAEFQASQGRPIQRVLLREAIRWDKGCVVEIARVRGGRKVGKMFRGAVELPFLLRSAARELPSLFRGYRFPSSAERLLLPFKNSTSPGEDDYADLVRYFALGWRTYRTAGGEGARYPGYPSWSGSQVDQLEGFSRTMPLFAAWCASGREPKVSFPDGEELSLPDEFERGLVAGTDPASPHYWGEMPGKSNQRIVEAADIALALWLFKDSVWPELGIRRQEQVVRWLALVEGAPGLDNNWHLFYVLIDRVLAGLGYPGRIPSARQRFERIKEFHLGDGWFRDGPEGKVDFYSAWGFHYALSWIRRIDPAWEAGFISSCQRSFLQSYRYLIGREGFPVLGRSVCYRIAAPAPLVFGQETDPDVVSPGEARRALDCIWSYFIRHGAVIHGTITQGYFGTDLRILDSYSGPASSMWSLRSLVAAFSYPREHLFWEARPAALPAEVGDFEIEVKGPGWRVRGDSGAICLDVLGNSPDARPSLEPFPWKQRLRHLATREPLRPGNAAAKYQRRRYTSTQPFCT